MLRSLILLFSFSFLFGSCSTKECCVYPELAEFHGEWELVKVVNGFAQLEWEGDEIPYKETLIINGETGTITFQRDDVAAEISAIEIKVEGGNDAIILKDWNEYQWYWFDESEGKTQLVLYQRAPLSAILADGSNFYYSKK
ncbi:hypothetical protein [Jiulongibacter sediminis]|uniref:hypothetical protein n=1 Tax=Jiulongibacter sediminis TaxID=1605367 RepID=UPI0010393DDF|nr:hypothetical protein [Jiulongibacter sediminis]